MILTTLFLQASPSEGFGSMMLPMLALLVVFYLFMILPQNRKRKKEKKFINRGGKFITHIPIPKII